jgi:gliding motility-associated protein GldC
VKYGIANWTTFVKAGRPADFFSKRIMTSEIKIQVTLNEDKIPSDIHWAAPGAGVDIPSPVKAMLLGLWDGQEKSALRIDLWTDKMPVEEMIEFYYQTFIGMAETYARATHNHPLADELKAYAGNFLKKARQALEKPEE